MRSVTDSSTPKAARRPEAVASAINDIDAVKIVCAALALAIVAVGFRIVAIW
jgi:hypothetical protein